MTATMDRLIRRLDDVAANPRYHPAIRQAAKKDARNYRTAQAGRRLTDVGPEAYEVLQALRAETQGFLDMSPYLRTRALALIAKMEER